MEKEIRYAEIPAYDQETQYVIEMAPVDMGDYIYIGLEVKDVIPDAPNDPNEQF
jgi:methyl coenzyme M reductase subunit C